VRALKTEGCGRGIWGLTDAAAKAEHFTTLNDKVAAIEAGAVVQFVGNYLLDVRNCYWSSVWSEYKSDFPTGR
jgi:hypothetical protein